MPASVALILLPIRIFLAAGWLRAGIEKFIDGTWWKGDKLHLFIDTHREHAIGWFRPVLDHAIAPGATIVAFVVMAIEIACGIAIVTGRHVRAALMLGVVLNVAFILSGQVNPSAFYLVMEVTMLFALAQFVVAPQPAHSRRLLVFAGLVLAAGIACIPSIRTIEPAKVIDDSAMMLTFLSVMVAGVLVLKWLSQRGTASLPPLLAPFLDGASRWAGVGRVATPPAAAARRSIENRRVRARAERAAALRELRDSTFERADVLTDHVQSTRT